MFLRGLILRAGVLTFQRPEGSGRVVRKHVRVRPRPQGALLQAQDIPATYSIRTTERHGVRTLEGSGHTDVGTSSFGRVLPTLCRLVA